MEVIDAAIQGTINQEDEGRVMKFQFGNVVVVDDDQIGVIVKSWEDNTHDVYIRSYNATREYKEEDIRHFIYSKTLTSDECEFYN
jgi:hypothetical protein